MVLLLSLPFIVTSSISLILGGFFLFLFRSLQYNRNESVPYFLVFAISATITGIYLGGFAVIMNFPSNVHVVNIANRITIISSMFTIILSIHFYICFFNYKEAFLLKYCYIICAVFSLLTLIPTPYFLANELYATSRYYTGLKFGFLFQVWGGWILILSVFCLNILFRVYSIQSKLKNKYSTSTVKVLLCVNVIWLITGISDALTGLQLIDLPPLTWIGSFLVICSIAWILAMHIDHLYEDKNSLNNRLMFDHLTQAHTRSYFELYLAQSIVEKDFSELYLCIIDVDNFKDINDSYGHINGDLLLKGIAKISKDAIRAKDCFARLGGDEFILLLKDEDLKGGACDILETIRSEIFKASFGTSLKTFKTSCSFGAVSVELADIGIRELSKKLLLHADRALYESKRQGKNKINITPLTFNEFLDEGLVNTGLANTVNA